MKSKSLIYRALLKYDYNNFEFIILKYCDVNELIEWEQYFIDNIKPEYNLLLVAGSSFGFKHSAETLLKLNNTQKNSWSYS